MTSVLVVSDLAVTYKVRRGSVRALDGANLSVNRGEVIGVVGESGSGKTTLATAAAGLLPSNARVTSGQVSFNGRLLGSMTENESLAFRRRELGFVFQDPIGTLDPTARIERQLRWLMGRKVPKSRLEELLSSVGLKDPTRVLAAYPHQLSGGMAQRVSIAMAIAHRPALVIADEPTASLDASIRLDILQLLLAQCKEAGSTMVLLTHDLRAVRSVCDRVAVMYGGRVVEVGPPAELFTEPWHPYTQGLLRAEPGTEGPGGELKPIPGVPPTLVESAIGCTFAPRCPRSDGVRCLAQRPPWTSATEMSRGSLCHYPLNEPAPHEGLDAREEAR